MISTKDMAEIKEKGSRTAGSVANEIAADEFGRLKQTKDTAKHLIDVNDRYQDAVKMMIVSATSLTNQVDSLKTKSKGACSSVKSIVNEVRDQLTKVDSILGDNVEHKVIQLERVALALKTIKDISGDTATMSIVKSMTTK